MNEETESFKETKKFLEGRIAAGQIRKCQCGKYLGEEYERCGECTSLESMAKDLNKDIKNTAK